MYWFNGSLSRLVALALLIVLALPVPSAQAQDDATWLYDQINGLRASLGLHGYAWNGALNAAAQAHSEWMAATGIISHEGEFDRGPGDRAVTFGYGGRSVTENIYGGGRANPQIAWNFWVNSGVHYAAIAHVNKNEIGIGVARGEGGTYYTLMFGQGSGVAAPAPPPPAQVPEEPVAPEILPVAEAASQAAEPPPQNVPAEPPPPTRPPITFTPSPTIPSQTPTITWTPTYTWTPSPTASIPPPTETPIRLATAIPLPTDTEIALAASPTQIVLQLLPAEAPEDDPPEPEAVRVVDESSDGIGLRQLLPIIIVVQVVGLGWVLWRLWYRKNE